MIHPHTKVQYIDPVKGNGLVASRPIPRSTIVWVHDPLDRIITPKEMEETDPRYREILLTYCFRNSQGNYVFCWDNGRFINHSFTPNCCLTAYGLEIAIRDIEPGQELTDDYGYLNIIEPFEADPEGGQRTMVYPDDLLRYADVWDASVREALPFLGHREQPLKPYLQDGEWEQLVRVAAGQEEMQSIMECYFDPDTAK